MLMDEASAFVTGAPPVPPVDASRCGEGVVGAGCAPPGRGAPPLEPHPAGYALKTNPPRKSQATGCPRRDADRRAPLSCAESGWSEVSSLPPAFVSLRPMRLRMAMTRSEAQKSPTAPETSAAEQRCRFGPRLVKGFARLRRAIR